MIFMQEGSTAQGREIFMKYVKSVLWIVCLCLLFAGCKKECIHEYQSEITVAASCTQAGVETLTCTLCQDSYTQPIPVAEHSYEPGEIEKEATCTQEGSQKYTCAECGNVKSKPVEKLAHTLDKATVIKEPNCMEEGENSGNCTVCGTVDAIVKIPTNDVHSYTCTVVKAATCTATGEGVNTCSLCQYSEPCQLEMKEHEYGTAEVLSNATCTKKGSQKRTCNICGYVAEETIEALGHKFTGATCTKAGTCSACGEKGKKASHNYVVVEQTKCTSQFASRRVRQCKSCKNEITDYCIVNEVINLNDVNAEVKKYAKKLGFQVVLGDGGTSEGGVTVSVWWMNLHGAGQKKLINEAKEKLNALRDQYAATSGGVKSCTVYISSEYTSAAYGSAGFRVNFGISN